jgi:hypothetical protein
LKKHQHQHHQQQIEASLKKCSTSCCVQCRRSFNRRGH